ncbi:MAG TPA: S-methyl-5-thioribose-1-phosphate isomerase [Oligoflexia bacterium]|nr:S-methyl-5-thioribose-1-phosphate isomerase [Oligoflexia bacterium]HMR25426.1 S-methyl-5-thioribose-1-phosphate isomerase [Oligoflexia bacterium]
MQPIRWQNQSLYLVNQLKLPQVFVEHQIDQAQDAASAIKNMLVRGAPAIGITAAYGIVLAAKTLSTLTLDNAQSQLKPWFKTFAQTRPTAVNLFWALDKMQACAEQNHPSTQAWFDALESMAISIHQQDIEFCKKIGNLGSSLLQETCKNKLKQNKKLNILTHCNAGALATGAWGTALGVIRSANQDNILNKVWVDETRPYLQGARLTAWELLEDKIPCTLITDNMASYFMQQQQVDAIIVGADRIAANGDTANKIGTYGLAVLAHYHNIPFFIAAPSSTIDIATKTGEGIPIEERSKQEVTHIGSYKIAPDGVDVAHPAFDITPYKLINAIITEKAVVEGDYEQHLSKLL